MSRLNLFDVESFQNHKKLIVGAIPLVTPILYGSVSVNVGTEPKHNETVGICVLCAEMEHGVLDGVDALFCGGVRDQVRLR